MYKIKKETYFYHDEDRDDSLNIYEVKERGFFILDLEAAFFFQNFVEIMEEFDFSVFGGSVTKCYNEVCLFDKKLFLLRTGPSPFMCSFSYEFVNDEMPSDIESLREEMKFSLSRYYYTHNNRPFYKDTEMQYLTKKRVQYIKKML